MVSTTFLDNTNTSAEKKLRCFHRRTAAVRPPAGCCFATELQHGTHLKSKGEGARSLQQAKQCTLLHCLCSLQCQLIIIKKHQAIVIPRLLSSDSTPLPNSQSDLCFHHGDVKSIPQINALEGTRTTCAMDSHIILHAGATEPGMARTPLSMVLPRT